MPVIIAYLCVVAIWSTTPLAIQWSNSSLPFMAAVTLRMVLALIVSLLLLLIMRQSLVKQASDWKAFAAGCIGIFPNMLLVYWSAQYIPSGMMAVVMGVYPFLVGVFAWFFLRENVFTVARVSALCMAVAGLALIHSEQLALGNRAVLGVLGMLVSSVLFALSSVWLKTLGGGVDPLRQSTGVLLLAAPCFVVVWWLTDGVVPQVVDLKSISGVVYLVIAGSVVGHTLYFFVLRNCTVGTVSLITWITPVIAMLIGVYFANERVTFKGGFGAVLIVLSLAVYQDIGRWLARWVRARRSKRSVEIDQAALSEASGSGQR